MAVVEFGNFPNSNYDEFSDITCHVTDGHTFIENADVAAFGKKMRVRTQAPLVCYSDTVNVRVHLLQFSGSHGTIELDEGGAPFWWCWTVRKSTLAQSLTASPVLQEIHQTNGNPTCPNLQQIPAPLNFAPRSANNQSFWGLVIRGSTDCAGGSFIQHAFAAPNTFSGIDNTTRFLNSWQGSYNGLITPGEWVHFMCGWLMSSQTNGWFEAWAGVHGTQMQKIVPRTNMRTCYPVPNNYPMLSQYYNANTTQVVEFEHANGGMSNNFAELQAFQAAQVGYGLWGVDASPPVIQSREGSLDTIRLTYNETLSPSGVPPTSAFVIKKQGGNPNPAVQPSFPIRGAFFYGWYDQAWTAHYQPGDGFYLSNNPTIQTKQIHDLEYAHIDAGIASWYAANDPRDINLKEMMQRTIALSSWIKWCVYYEREAFELLTSAQIATDLTYIRDNLATSAAYLKVAGKFVVFVYSPSSSPNAPTGNYDGLDGTGKALVDRYLAANALISNAAYISLKVYNNYQQTATQPNSWHQYYPPAAESSSGGSGNQYFVISPGFWGPTDTNPQLTRDATRWQQNIANMLASNAPWQLITTYNEWYESSSVETSV